MTINKCSFESKHLEPLINNKIESKQALNDLIKRIRSAMRIADKKDVNGAFTFLDEQQAKEIQDKINKINEREFPENFKKRIDSITKALKKFLDKHQKSTETFGAIENQMNLSSVHAENEQAKKLSTTSAVRSTPVILQENEVEEGENIFGIENITGNDCYQNSLCQFLQCKRLKEQFIDRLPDNLWREFNRRPIHSKTLRDLIRQETVFADDKDYIQQDSDELLTCLSYKLNENEIQAELAKTTLKTNSSEKTTLIKKRKTFSQKIKSCFFSLALFPFFIWKSAFKFLRFCVNKARESQMSNMEQEIESIPLYPIVRPKRKTSSDPNPLISTICEHRKWNVSNVPDEFKKHDYFGGETNQSIHSLTGLSFLKLKITENKNFESILESYFEEKEEDSEGSTLKENHEIKAKFSVSRYFQNEPSSLFLAISRFYTENGSSKKYREDIEGIPATFKLPSKALNEKEPEKELELQSFIVHLGSSLNSGHFICYRKVEGEWYLFNDEKASKVSENQALEASKQAYLIFYDEIESK